MGSFHTKLSWVMNSTMQHTQSFKLFGAKHLGNSVGPRNPPVSQLKQNPNILHVWPFSTRRIPVLPNSIGFVIYWILLYIEFSLISTGTKAEAALSLLFKKQSNCLRAVFCCCILPENQELQRRQAQLCLSPTPVLWMEGSGKSVRIWHLGTWSGGERAGEWWDLSSLTIPQAGWHGPAGVSAGWVLVAFRAWGNSCSTSHRHGRGLSWSEFPHSHCWPFLLHPHVQGIGIPCRIWGGLAGLEAVPVSSAPRAGSLGSFGCSFPSLLPPWKWRPALAQHISI